MAASSSDSSVHIIPFATFRQRLLLIGVSLACLATAARAEDSQIKVIEFGPPVAIEQVQSEPIKISTAEPATPAIVFDQDVEPAQYALPPGYQPRFQVPLQVAQQPPLEAPQVNTDADAYADDLATADAEPPSCWTPAPLAAVNTDIILPAGMLPRDYASECLDDAGYVDGCYCVGRGWCTLGYQWAATSLCHRPLYFEEPNLERYGYGCGHCVQPFVSAAHFFARVPALPYLMATDCPWECNYTLGHYRPGTRCVPWRRSSVPLHLRRALAQGGIVTALVFILP